MDKTRLAEIGQCGSKAGAFMARTKRSAKLDTRTSRLKAGLEAGKMHQEPLAPGQYLAYRKPEKGGAGSWFARWHREGKILQTRLGTADDFEDADKRPIKELSEADLKELKILSYAHAQKKAQSYFGEREHQAIHGDDSLPIDGPLTVAQAVDRYIARKEAEGGKSTKDSKQRADLWIKPHLGSIEVAKLTRAKVEAWQKLMAESERQIRRKPKPEPKSLRKKKAEAEPKPEEARKPTPEELEDTKRKRKASANRVLAILKAALTCARERGWVTCSGDAWEVVKPFRGVEEPRQQYMTPQEQQRFLNAIERPDFKRLVSGALATGCRYSELTRMRVKDFDPTNHGSVLVRLSKSGKSRRVILTTGGRALFQSLTAGRGGDELIFLLESVERRTRDKSEPLAWDKNDQQRMMKDACKAAGLPEMGFHQLRHSYASALVAEGVPLALVAQLTGHADTRMLERHYAHLAPSDLSRALEKMAPKLDYGMGNVEDLKIKQK